MKPGLILIKKSHNASLHCGIFFYFFFAFVEFLGYLLLKYNLMKTKMADLNVSIIQNCLFSSDGAIHDHLSCTLLKVPDFCSLRSFTLVWALQILLLCTDLTHTPPPPLGWGNSCHHFAFLWALVQQPFSTC